MSLVSICIAVFVVQVLLGVSATSPASQDLLVWGANHVLLTLEHDWWRTISAVFIHIGLMHLMFNTYALYLFGQVCEKIFGAWYYLGLFLLAGIGGNLLNNAYTLYNLSHTSSINQAYMPVSAGASGGIMGLGGALFVLALLKVRIGGMVIHFKTIATIMLINLGFGFAVPGIDNAAHIGGMLTGGALAAAFVVVNGLKNTTPLAAGLHMAVLLVTLIAFGFIYTALQGFMYDIVTPLIPAAAS